MNDRIDVGRTDLDGPLRRYLVAGLGLVGAAYLFRGIVYYQTFGLFSDLENGDLDVLDRARQLVTLTRTMAFVGIAAYFIQGRLYRRWLTAANANALTRPDIGLRWLRHVPSAKHFQAWHWTWNGCILSSIVLGFLFRSGVRDIDGQRLWALVQMAITLGLEVAIVGAAVTTRKLTAELKVWLDAPMPPLPQPVVSAETPESEPIA